MLKHVFHTGGCNIWSILSIKLPLILSLSWSLREKNASSLSFIRYPYPWSVIPILDHVYLSLIPYHYLWSSIPIPDPVSLSLICYHYPWSSIPVLDPLSLSLIRYHYPWSVIPIFDPLSLSLIWSTTTFLWRPPSLTRGRINPFFGRD